MSFANVQELSRSEMREIMAGSGSGGCGSCKNQNGAATCVRNAGGGCNCPVYGTCK